MGGGKQLRMVLSACAGLALVSSASAATLAGISPDGIVYHLNPLTGHASNPWDTGLGSVVGMSYSPNGEIYVLTNSSAVDHPAWLYAIDSAHGIAPVGPTGLPALVEGDIAIDPATGTLYGGYDTENNGRRLFTLDPSSGTATYLPFTPGGDISALAFDDGGALYALDTLFNRLLTVDKTNGAQLTSVTLNRTLGPTAGMTFDPDTGTLYAVDGGAGASAFYKLDPATGVVTTVGLTGVPAGFAGLAFVPEPGTLVLLALGAAAWARRRA